MQHRLPEAVESLQTTFVLFARQHLPGGEFDKPGPELAGILDACFATNDVSEGSFGTWKRHARDMGSLTNPVYPSALTLMSTNPTSLVRETSAKQHAE